MRYLKIIIGLSGIILFIVGAAVNLTTYFKLKKQGVESVFKYAKANPDKVKNAKKWGSIGSIGFWLMFAANYINDWCTLPPLLYSYQLFFILKFQELRFRVITDGIMHRLFEAE